MQRFQKELDLRFDIKPGDYLYEVERRSKMHLDKITNRGIRIDLGFLREQESLLRDSLGKDKLKVAELSRGRILKPNSSVQVANYLESVGYQLERTAKGNPVTRADSLEKIDDEIIEPILRYRQNLALHGQILGVVSEGKERVYPEFDGLTCPTGRIYSKSPNIMGWGKGMQKCIIPDEGFILKKVDYKAQELRILAALCDCKNLKKAFQQGKDPHEWVASVMLGKRDVSKEEREFGKVLNFGTVYGQTPEGLARNLNCSVEEARSMHKKYHEEYPEIKRWSAEVIERTRRLGYSETFFGRRRKIDLAGSAWWMQDKKERQAINTPIQGTGADLIKIALARIPSNANKLQILFPWHDALVLQYREDVDFSKIQDYIESIMVVEIGDIRMEVDWK